MHRSKPDLIVPVRDRRQHKRYVTLRNARNVFIALVVLFIGITIRSEMEPKHRESFGDLMQRELPQSVETKPIEIVREAAPAVADQTAADPMLVAPAAREQWLHGQSETAPLTVEPIQTAPIVAADVRPGTKSRIAIVGGVEGVSVVDAPRRRATLSGGFGR